MSEPQPLSTAEEADLAALADGRLAGERRAALEAQVAADPRLRDALARQRAGLHAIAAATESVSAPLALRARVEAMQREAAAGGRRGRRWPALGRWLPAVGLAAAAAAAVLVVLVGGAPSTESVLAAATRPPVATVSLDPGRPGRLRERVEAVQFPDYAAGLGWQATGTRTDTIDGRDTRTVFYRRDGATVAYTIVAGDALPWPELATRSGGGFRTFTAGARTVVTWREQGQTCVLSGRGVPRETLLQLAAWGA